MSEAIGKTLFKFTSKKLFKILEEDFEEGKKTEKRIRSFTRKVGGNPRKGYASWGSDSGSRLAGIYFDKEPNRKAWTKNKHEDTWHPKFSKSKLGEEFNSFKWYPDKIKKALKWNNIYSPHVYYSFSLFCNEKRTFAGICVPIFETRDIKKDKGIEYKPVKGLKEITYGEYKRCMGL